MKPNLQAIFIFNTQIQKMIKKKITTVLFILLCINSSAQKNYGNAKDSLVSKDYEYLSKSANNPNTKSCTYANYWLSKSKLEKNWKQAALAYKCLMYKADKKLLLQYSDSLIETATLTKDNSIIGASYLTKGIIYYDLKEHKKALDNYILADKYLVTTNDHYNIYKTKYSIAHIKYYLGFYEEAISLFSECIEYFKLENDRAYLNSIHSIGLCYNKIKNYKLCSFYNNLGIEESYRLDNFEMKPFFIHSEGINLYFKKNYTQAIKNLIEVLPFISKKKDFGNETVANFYIAKSYWALNQIDNAIPYLLKVDDAITNQNYARPDLRENYELLIKYYKKKNINKLQLKYINKLLRTDSILNQKYVYLSRKVFKEYDTIKLQNEKEKIEGELNFNYKTNTFVIASLTAFSIFLIYRHQKNKKIFKQKFEELMKENNSKKEPIPNDDYQETETLTKNTSNEEVDLKPELIALILKNIEKFEQNKKYLEKEMTQSKIASILNTNTKYASKIIFKYRNKKTIDYINDLKVDHIVDILKNEKKYRLYTNKALADEAGFGSTQNFTRAFNSRTGISPTYFINELNKLN